MCEREKRSNRETEGTRETPSFLVRGAMRKGDDVCEREGVRERETTSEQETERETMRP